MPEPIASSGRALAIAELIRMHGPHRAAEMVADANREHRLSETETKTDTTHHNERTP